jgi:hypothetical protein
MQTKTTSFLAYSILGLVCATFISSLTIITRCAAEDFRSPRTQALGGAGHAAPLLNDAMYLNPSYSAFLPTYSISGNLDWYSYDQGAYNGKLWNASVQDGQDPLFQAGIGYTHFTDGSLITFGASKAAMKQLGFGLGAKYFIPNDGSGNHVGDFNYSTEFLANAWLQASFIADNLIQSAVGKQYGYYREFTIGTKFSIQNILFVYFDPHLAPDANSTNGSHFGHESGLELQIFEDLFLRGGLYTNSNVPSLQLRGNGWGTGIGWVGPKISLDYAYSRNTSPINDDENTIGTTIYF